MKEITKNIRKELKERYGYNNRQVSVKIRNYCVIDIFIKSENVDIKNVEKIQQKYEEFEMDEVTGEILQGGNTFIFIKERV